MYHLIYTSMATTPFSEGDLIQLLEQSRTLNKKVGITGMLMYTRSKFIQVLEGEQSIVNKLYAKIVEDDRHKKITTVLEGESEERIFKDWAMGFKKLGGHEFESLTGFTDLDDFFKDRSTADAHNLVLIFLKLFYKKNIVDYPESIL
jgi:Sensors of blue-light using FAD